MSPRRIQDPARTALAAVFADTLRKHRFPRKALFLRDHPALAPLIERLLRQRRYLAEAEYRNAKGKRVVRLAVTIPGIYELENQLSHREHEQLAVLLSTLQAWRQRGLFTKLTPIADVHHEYGFDCELTTFARQLTMLCSPRLLNPLNKDPVGFYGQSPALSIPHASTGFVEHLILWPHFEQLQLPRRGRRRLQLLPDKTLRYELEPAGTVSIYEGLRHIGSLKPGLGAQVFTLLFDRPNQPIEILDLQAAAAGLLDLHDLEDPSEAYLEDWDIDPSTLSPDSRRRLSALCRRLDLYDSLPEDTSTPKWAAKPERSRRRLEDDIRAQLIEQRIPADFPPIKNAARVIRRALKDALPDPSFDALRERFSLGDAAAYLPAKRS